jgi:hypothetical protein
MNKLIGWVVGLTKIGSIVKKIQDFLDGKKQALASLAAAVPATVTIIVNFADKGTPYLMQIASTPEFLAASAGWIGLFNAIKGEKIRAEIAAAAAPKVG